MDTSWSEAETAGVNKREWEKSGRGMGEELWGASWWVDYKEGRAL